MSVDVKQEEKKCGIGAYISLLFACVFFSGVLAGADHWYGIFDFSTLNGGFGRLVSNVTFNGETVQTSRAIFRGTGGTGAIDGFAFALSLVPTVMFALASIAVFEYYGALEAARRLLTPVLRPLLGIPGTCSLALIASLQSTDGGAALTRQLKDSGEINQVEAEVFGMFQFSADATITNFMGVGVALLSLTAATGETVPTSIGVCLVVMLVLKFFGANLLRFILLFMKGKKTEEA